jgi:hypothetical protein
MCVIEHFDIYLGFVHTGMAKLETVLDYYDIAILIRTRRMTRIRSTAKPTVYRSSRVNRKKWSAVPNSSCHPARPFYLLHLPARVKAVSTSTVSYRSVAVFLCPMSTIVQMTSTQKKMLRVTCTLLCDIRLKWKPAFET